MYERSTYDNFRSTMTPKLFPKRNLYTGRYVVFKRLFLLIPFSPSPFDFDLRRSVVTAPYIYQTSSEKKFVYKNNKLKPVTEARGTKFRGVYWRENFMVEKRGQRTSLNVLKMIKAKQHDDRQSYHHFYHLSSLLMLLSALLSHSNK